MGVDLLELTAKTRVKLDEGLKRYVFDEKIAQQWHLYESVGLKSPRYRLEVEDRCKHIVAQGLEEMTLEEAVQLMSGRKVKRSWETDRRDSYEWTGNWHSYNRLRFAFGLLSGFTYTAAHISALTTPAPYGVALLLKECKDVGLFNLFVAVAPSEAFVKPRTIDPVILGCVLSPYESGLDRYFFLAKW
jgi:hypothetical protein